MSRAGALLLGLAALPAAAIGQDPAVLEPVVVTATRQPENPDAVPAALTAIDAADLRRARPALDLAESLPRVPGVVVRDRHNQAQDLQLSIRGFGARASFGVRGLRLYSDGIPATMPDGQGQVSHFALTAAERIEVLRGPFSALYGNAAGGVVAVFSAPPPPRPESEAEAVAGAHGLWRLGAAWRGPLGAAGGLAAQAETSAADGFRQHSAWRREAAQALWRGGFGAGGEATLLLNHLDLRADDPQGLTAAQLAADRRAASAGALAFDTRKTVAQQQAGLRLVQPLGAAQELALVAYTGRRRTFQMLSVPVAAQASPTSGGGAIELDRGYRGADLRWRFDAADGRFGLALGAASERADETRRGFENFAGAALGVRGALRRDEDNSVRGDDAYAQLHWRPGGRWRLDAGLRHSRVRFASRDRYLAAGNPDDSGRLAYSRLSPVLGLSHEGAAGWTAYANLGAGFETPTFAELAYRPDGQGGLNAALRPARSRHAELGLRLRRGAWRGELALFQARTRDELVVLSSQGGRSVFGNAAGPTRRRGLEAGFEAGFAPGWHAAAAYTWLDARFDDGRRIPGLSRHAAWAELRRALGPGTDLVLETRAASRFYADDANTAAAPGHALFDLGLEHRFEAAGLAWRAYARIENLLDRDSVGAVIVNEANGRYFEPAPGRTWLLGVSVVRAAATARPRN